MPYGVTAVYFCAVVGLDMSRVVTNDAYLFLQQSVTEDSMFGTKEDLFYFYLM